MTAMTNLLRRMFLSRGCRWFAGALAALQFTNRQGASAAAVGRVSGFDHVAVPMRDASAMVRFYRALGFQVHEGERICSVHFGEHKINFHRPSLWQDSAFRLRAPSAQPPCGDFCFVWEGSPANLAEVLARAGAAVIEGPVQRQGGRSGGAATGVSHYTRDPDGNLLEFIVY